MFVAKQTKGSRQILKASTQHLQLLLFSLQANIVLVFVIYVIMLVLMGFSFYEDPVTMGIGLALFVGGVPIYLFFKILSKTQRMKSYMGANFFILYALLHSGLSSGFVDFFPFCAKQKDMTAPPLRRIELQLNQEM